LKYHALMAPTFHPGDWSESSYFNRTICFFVCILVLINTVPPRKMAAILIGWLKIAHTNLNMRLDDFLNLGKNIK